MIVIAVLLYLGSQLGQKLGAWQTFELRRASKPRSAARRKSSERRGGAGAYVSCNRSHLLPERSRKTATVP